MSQVACPKCGKAVVFVAELSGELVGCPTCIAHFVMEDPAVIAEPPPMLRTGSSSTARRTSPRSYRAYANRAGLRPASTIFDVFDFTFETYVTPLIIKVTWVLAVLFSGLWLVALVTLCAITWVPDPVPRPEPSEVSPPSITKSRPRPPFREPTNDDGFDWGDWVNRKTVATAAYLQAAVAIVLALLWTRVVLETVIVLFHIATSIRSLDAKTPNVS